jgi:hypothetical protein
MTFRVKNQRKMRAKKKSKELKRIWICELDILFLLHISLSNLSENSLILTLLEKESNHLAKHSMWRINMNLEKTLYLI